MPTNWKFKIENQVIIKAKLVELGFIFKESKVITDIYLESPEHETKKLRIENKQHAKLIHFERDVHGSLVSHPSIVFEDTKSALDFITKHHKESKRLDKNLDIYELGTTRACIHDFHSALGHVYLSIEEDDEGVVLGIMQELRINTESRILENFSEVL